MNQPVKNTKRHPQTSLLTMASAVAIAVTALATPSAYAQGESSLSLEEVLVTARKRTESIQDVPISVTSIGKELKEASIRRLDDIQSFTPNVYIRNTSGTPGGASISIRGVSYQETDKSYDPAIGVVMDGMYLGTSSGSLLNNFDIERIEVLRGPQGTLFGKNTVGGVINIIRGPVTKEWGGDLSVTLGDDGREDYKAVINVPIIEDKLGVKLFANDINSDGYMYNTTLQDDVGGDDYQTYGFATQWDPSENFSAKLHYEHHENDTEGAWANFNQPDHLACILEGALWPVGDGCQANDTGSDEDNVSNEIRNSNESKYDTTILTLNWDLGDFLITSITGNREQNEHNLSGFDASPAALLYLDYFNDWEQFSQELRLTSQFSEKVEFVTGLYYWDVEYEQSWDTGQLFYALDQIGQIVPGVPGGAGFPEDILGHNGQSQETTSIAAFFSGDWHVTDQWTITAGVRWTEEEKDFVGSDAEFYPAGTPIPQANTTAFDDDWSEISPKLGFRYAHTDDMMFFGSYSEGFKSGGFFGRQADFNGPDPTYEPEFVENWELGMKSEWMDGRLIFNPTVFFSNYDDKQEEILVPINLGNVATVVRNASTLEIFGAEMELQFQITEAWYVRGSYGYLDAEYKDYLADVNGDGVITDNSGLRSRNTPENTFGLSSTYTIDVGPGQFQAYGAYRWRDEIEVIASNNPLGHMDSIQNLDVTLSYSWGEGHRFRVTGYGRNITDEREVTVAEIPTLVAWGNWNEGATYGAEFAVSF
ncbi:MAG: iron complex outermembrane receptor protein [Halioglobus sp.]|jgi:iron complex outermembrane receptor protein